VVYLGARNLISALTGSKYRSLNDNAHATLKLLEWQMGDVTSGYL